jgi:hypothetical protein
MTTTAIKPSFKYEKSENEFTVYANHTGIGLSNFDIRLMFGQIDMKMEQEKPISGGAQELTIIKLGSVIMSPVHAKLVCANLQANIERYEKMFGNINMPPQQVPTP